LSQHPGTSLSHLPIVVAGGRTGRHNGETVGTGRTAGADETAGTL